MMTITNKGMKPSKLSDMICVQSLKRWEVQAFPPNYIESSIWEVGNATTRKQDTSCGWAPCNHCNNYNTCNNCSQDYVMKTIICIPCIFC